MRFLLAYKLIYRYRARMPMVLFALVGSGDLLARDSQLNNFPVAPTRYEECSVVFKQWLEVAKAHGDEAWNYIRSHNISHDAYSDAQYRKASEIRDVASKNSDACKKMVQEFAQRQFEEERIREAGERERADKQRAAERMRAKEEQREAQRPKTSRRSEQFNGVVRSEKLPGSSITPYVPSTPLIDEAQKKSSSTDNTEQSNAVYDEIKKRMGNNPFDWTLTKAGEATNSALIGARVDAIDGKSTKDFTNPEYEQTMSVIERARSSALSANPFADAVTRESLSLIGRGHQAVLGKLDGVEREIDSYGKGDVAPSKPSGVESPKPTPPANVGKPSGYYDPESGITLEIPTGHALYRDPDSGILSVVNLAGSFYDGDRADAGERGCSVAGMGIVIPACERIRKKRRNPFATPER